MKSIMERRKTNQSFGSLEKCWIKQLQMKEKGFFMLFLTKKWINIGFLIIHILLVSIIVPAPTYDNDKLDDYVNINNNQWKFIVVKEGQ